MSDTLHPDLAEIFADIMDADPATVGPGTTPEDVPEWDSLSNVRLVMALERRFGVQFANDQISSWQSLGDIQASLPG